MNCLKMTVAACPSFCQESTLKFHSYCRTVGYRQLRAPRWTFVNGLAHCFLGILTLGFGIVGLVIKHALCESIPMWTSSIFFALGIFTIIISRRKTLQILYRIGFIVAIVTGVFALVLLAVAVAALTLQTKGQPPTSAIQFTRPSPYGYPYVRTDDITAGVINLIMMIIISLAEIANCVLTTVICWKLKVPKETRSSISIIGQEETEVTSSRSRTSLQEENEAFEELHLPETADDGDVTSRSLSELVH